MRKKRCTARLLNSTMRKMKSAYESNFVRLPSEKTVSRSTKMTVVTSLKTSSFRPSSSREGMYESKYQIYVEEKTNMMQICSNK